MTRIVRTLVAVDPELVAEDIAGAVPEGQALSIVGLTDLVQARVQLEKTPVDLLVVGSTLHSEAALQLIQAADDLPDDVPVLVLSEGTSNGYVRRLLEAGADDILQLPQGRADVEFAIRKLFARRETGSILADTDRSKLIVILGPKGGTGKTLTATNLAVALAGTGASAAIVDLDLQFGDVALTLGLAPERTIHDVATAAGGLDAEVLDHFMVRHESGVRALLAPPRPDQASAVSVELIRNVYSHLRHAYDFTIVDTPPGFTSEVIASIDASTDLVMVGMLDSLSLKNTKLGLETLDLMGYKRERIRLVLNRAQSNVGISQSDVVAVLGREPDVYVPSNREIPRAVNEGVTIVQSRPDSEAAAAFNDLARIYGGASPPSLSPEPRRRLLGRRR